MTQLKRTLGRVDLDKVMRLVLRSVPLVPAPEIYDLVRDLQTSRGELDVKVNQAVESIKTASALVSDLEGELNQKLEQVEKLKLEYERYHQLAAVEEEKSRTLLREVQAVLSSNQARERWIALWINLAAGVIVFVIGIWVGPKITQLLHIR